jgi:hypothetical protein
LEEMGGEETTQKGEARKGFKELTITEGDPKETERPCRSEFRAMGLFCSTVFTRQ